MALSRSTPLQPVSCRAYWAPSSFSLGRSHCAGLGEGLLAASSVARKMNCEGLPQRLLVASHGVCQQPSTVYLLSSLGEECTLFDHPDRGAICHRCGLLHIHVARASGPAYPARELLPKPRHCGGDKTRRGQAHSRGLARPRLVRLSGCPRSSLQANPSQSEPLSRSTRCFENDKREAARDSPRSCQPKPCLPGQDQKQQGALPNSFRRIAQSCGPSARRMKPSPPHEIAVVSYVGQA